MVSYQKRGKVWQYDISYKDKNGEYKKIRKSGFKLKSEAIHAASEIQASSLLLATNNQGNQSKPSTETKPNGSTSQSKPSTTKPNKPSKPTTEKPSKPSNGKEEQKEDVSLTEIVAAVKKAYGDGYLPNMTIDEDVLAEQYGIKKNMYEEVIAEGPMLSFQIDTFIAVKAKDGKAETVKAAMEKYKQYLLDESMQYPMNASKIPATQVYRFGNYVFFSMLVSPQGEEPESEEAYLEAAKKQNQIAYDTIAKFFS